MLGTMVIYGENDKFNTINKIIKYLSGYFNFFIIKNNKISFEDNGKNKDTIVVIDTNNLSNISLENCIVICKSNFCITFNKGFNNNLFVVNSSKLKEVELTTKNYGRFFVVGDKSTDMLTYSSIDDVAITVAVMRGFKNINNDYVEPLEIPLSYLKNENVYMHLVLCFILLYFNAKIDFNKKIILNSTNFQ